MHIDRVSSLLKLHFYEFAERRLGLEPFSHIPGIALELLSSIVRQ